MRQWWRVVQVDVVAGQVRRIAVVRRKIEMTQEETEIGCCRRCLFDYASLLWQVDAMSDDEKVAALLLFGWRR